MKSKKKVIAIILLFIVLIAGTAFAYLYFCTDMFKTPEELFYKYVSQAAKTEEKYNYQNVLEELKTTQTKSYIGKTKVGIELKSTGKSYTSLKNQATYNVINGLGLEIQTKSNPSENKAAFNMQLNYEGSNITELELLKDKDLYGVKSEFLDNKYIAVENKSLKELMKKLGGTTSGIPDKIEFLDIYELLYISKEEQEKIANTYKKIVQENITPDKFIKEENVIQKVNNEDKNTTVYALKISEKDFYNLMIDLLEAAKEDEIMLNLITDKVNAYLNASPAIQNYINERSLKTSSKINLTNTSLKEILEKMIDELKNEVEYADENSNAEFVLYVENEETVRIEFRLNQEIQMAIDFYSVEDKKHVVLYVQDTGYSKYSTYYKGTSSRKQSSELEKVMEMEYKKEKNGEETKLEGNIVVYDEDEEAAKISFDIATKGEVGQGKNESRYKINIEAEEISIGFTIDSEIEYTDNVEIEELNKKNATILNDMSKTEIEKFFNKIEKNFEEKIQDKMENLGLINSVTSKSTKSSLLN